MSLLIFHQQLLLDPENLPEENFEFVAIILDLFQMVNDPWWRNQQVVDQTSYTSKTC